MKAGTEYWKISRYSSRQAYPVDRRGLSMTLQISILLLLINLERVPEITGIRVPMQVFAISMFTQGHAGRA